jgi:type 1 glutamine amidotransferase
MMSLTALSLIAMSMAAPPEKRLLLVTHSGGFIHDSVGVAEDILKEIGPKYGYAVTCWRYTGDPAEPGFKKYQDDFRAKAKKTVEPENCGRINAQTLKNFDVVLFFTTGSGRGSKKKDIGPLTAEELKDLTAWVRAGGAFCGTHCASDTMYDSTYGELIGGWFKSHPHQQKVKLRLEDAKHPAAAGMSDGMEWFDEYYIFLDAPYDRKKLHIILSIDPATFTLSTEKDDAKREAREKALKRSDGDYAVAWCKEEGKGKVFYTSLGHRQEVWKDERFQKHLFGGIDWAMNKAKGDATPSGK